MEYSFDYYYVGNTLVKIIEYRGGRPIACFKLALV